MIPAINSSLQSVSRTKIEKPHNVASKAVLPQQIDNAHSKKKPNVNFTSTALKVIGWSALVGAVGVGGASLGTSLGTAEAVTNLTAFIGWCSAGLCGLTMLYAISRYL